MLEQHKNNTPQQVEVKLQVENSIKLDPENPIPIQYGGDSFYVVTGKKYVPLLGRKDDLPNLLLEARLTSTTHNACIASIAQSVVGKGISVIDVEKPSEALIEWMKNVNNVQKSFDETLKAITDGERTFGNQFVEVIRGSLSGKKFLKIKLHSPLYCRLSEPNNEDVVESVLISKLFARRGMRKLDLDKTRIVPLWSDNILDQSKAWKKNDNGTESTMLHFKNEVSGIDYYGLPASISGLRYTVLEGKSAQYNIDDFENNMVLGGMIVFKGAMTQEEAKLNAKEILLSHLGEGKSGRWAVLSSEQGINDVEIIPHNTRKEGSYKELNKSVEDKIIVSHNWAREFCFSESAGLGKGSGYIRSLWDLKESTLLNPLRKRLIDSVVKPIMQIYADYLNEKEVLKYNFRFASAMPFSFMGDIDPDKFMQVNEAREMAGLETDDSKKGVYLSEMSSKQKDVQTKPITEEGADHQ